MREIIPTRLWIGNAKDARNVTGVLGLGVSAIVDLAVEEPPIQFPRDVVYCRFPLIDGTGNQPAILRVAIDTVAYFIASRTPTLVACGSDCHRTEVGTVRRRLDTVGLHRERRRGGDLPRADNSVSGQ